MLPRCLASNQQNQLFFFVGKAASFPQHVIFISPSHQHVHKWKFALSIFRPTPTAHLCRAWNFSFLSWRSVNFHFPTKTAIKFAIFAKKNCVHFSSISNWKLSLISFNQSPKFAIFGSCCSRFSDSEEKFAEIQSFSVFKWEFKQKLFSCSLIFETFFIPEKFSPKLKLESCLFKLSSVWLAVKCVMCRFSRTGNRQKKKKKFQRKREKVDKRSSRNKKKKSLCEFWFRAKRKQGEVRLEVACGKMSNRWWKAIKALRQSTVKDTPKAETQKFRSIADKNKKVFQFAFEWRLWQSLTVYVCASLRVRSDVQVHLSSSRIQFSFSFDLFFAFEIKFFHQEKNSNAKVHEIIFYFYFFYSSFQCACGRWCRGSVVNIMKRLCLIP